MTRVCNMDMNLSLPLEEVVVSPSSSVCAHQPMLLGCLLLHALTVCRQCALQAVLGSGDTNTD
jgi:hypothetical protein